MEPYADNDVKRKKRKGDFFRNTGIQGWILVSKEGLPISSELSIDVNESVVSAAIAAIQSVSEGVVEELARGGLKRILIDGVDGKMILSEAGKKAILCILVESNTGLGKAFLENKIAEWLDDLDKDDNKNVE